MSAPAPGWHPDPSGTAPRRWWDGAQWTPYTDAVKPSVPELATEPYPTLPFAVAWWTIAGILVSVVGSELLSEYLVDHAHVSAAVAIALFYVPAYGGIFATCVAVSRRFGTGSLVEDFGWRMRPTDVFRGLLVAFFALIASVVANSPWAKDDRITHTDRALRNAYAHLPVVALIEVGVALAVLAPLIEELAFRGALLRSLSARMTVGWAVVVQAALFGIYHYTPGLGRANEPGVVVRAAAGLVLGFAAYRWRRLGPGTWAHCAVNTLVAVLFIVSH